MAQDGITVSIPGARDLIAELRELKEDVARRTARKAVAEAGNYILARLKANAPVFTGKLRFNLDVVTRWKSRSGIMQSKVRVWTKGKAEDPRNAFYWRFLHRGTKFIKRDNFIERTAREVQQPAASIFFRALETALNKRRGKLAQ